MNDGPQETPIKDGSLRGLGLAVASAVILGIISILERGELDLSALPAELLVFIPILIAVLRIVEAWLLDYRKR